MLKITMFFIFLIMHFSIYAADMDAGINKPNIIIFYVDDLGWQDSQLNDIDEPTPWETPNMLALAHRGMNFTQAYSPAPTCAPSRAGLLSGQHPAKLNLTHVLGATVPKPVNDKSRLIAPYINDHFSPDTLTLSEALKDNGYETGHVGKWHLGHYASNSPLTEGFDFSYGERGLHRRTADRSKDFESTKYPLSEEKYAPKSAKNPSGIAYPYDSVTENALNFIEKNKDKPFFLYLAHWMVHVPIVTRNRALLEYYTDKLDIPFPQDPSPITSPGQVNPYYGAMVTTVDWSLGRLISLLEETDDPRNPGKKLIETTYVFLSSDNGGVENKSIEVITDNYPLDMGKKYTQEGGIRVPLVISGPGVAKGLNHHGLVNQLDFFPTILSLTKSIIAKEHQAKLSGLDLSNVLSAKADQLINAQDEVRKNLFWHFPHNLDTSMRSALREGDFKLYKNYIDNTYSLYRLYKDGNRFDLEERTDLASSKEYANVLSKLSSNLNDLLEQNNAITPYLNPDYKGDIMGKSKVPQILSNTFDKKTQIASISLAKGKTKLKEAFVLVEISGPKAADNKEGKTKVTYKKLMIDVQDNNFTLSTSIPSGHEAYLFVLIDANDFLVTSERYEIS